MCVCVVCVCCVCVVCVYCLCVCVLCVCCVCCVCVESVCVCVYICEFVNYALADIREVRVRGRGLNLPSVTVV